MFQHFGLNLLIFGQMKPQLSLSCFLYVDFLRATFLQISTSPYCKATAHVCERTFEAICVQHVIMNKEEKLRLPCLLTELQTVEHHHSCDFDQSKSAFFATLTANFSNALPYTRKASLLFYTYVDNFVDRQNKRESYFCASFQNCGVLKTPQAPGDATVLKTVFSAITSVIFRHRSKRIAFLESMNFFYV